MGWDWLKLSFSKKDESALEANNETSGRTTSSSFEDSEERRRRNGIVQRYKMNPFSPSVNRPGQASCRISYYDVLGVDKMASPVEIRKAYRRRARQLHPDKTGDSSRVDEFRQLQKAYDVLNDPNLRPIYDRFGVDGVELCNGLSEPQKQMLAKVARKKWLTISLFTIFILLTGMLTCCFCCFCCCLCCCAPIRKGKESGNQQTEKVGDTTSKSNRFPRRSLRRTLGTADSDSRLAEDEGERSRRRRQRKSQRKEITPITRLAQNKTENERRTKPSRKDVSSCSICSTINDGQQDVIVVFGLESPL
ncbi:hypothetical protein WR25_01884 [Diploscapter pachys]|uniref:J domain-containing protein n=1 Tax=Diploscapter pachys TaxID=2018661 RepID=A0A2A2LAD5_9BILA|nr:hypothetical protein WR25_01884 [Diploscapter pachys]